MTSRTTGGRPWAISIQDLRRGSFCDLAASKKTRADYTVVATGGIDDALNLYILDILRGRWEWPQARQKIIDELLAQEVEICGIETAGFQLSAFQELIIEPELAHIAFRDVPVSTDKTSRALLVSAKAANGKLFIRHGAPWKPELVEEFCSFPGRHDDIVDAVSGLAELLLATHSSESNTAPSSVMKAENAIKIKRKHRGRRRK